MRFAAIVILALAFAASSAGADPLLDRSADRVLHRTDITSRGGKHGEVRLVERESTRVVQTLLYTKLLRRVLGEIRNRERENWPVDREGREASEQYISALERAERAIPRSTVGDKGAAAERRRPLLIEFAVSHSETAVLLLQPRVEESEGLLAVEGASLIERIDLPADFVQRDMRLILEEHFPGNREALAWLLAPLEPALETDSNKERTRDVGP